MPAPRSALSASTLLAALIPLSVACGARSGLLAYEPAAMPDAGADASPGSDAPADAPSDGSDAGDALAPPCPSGVPTAGEPCASRGAICAYRTGKMGPCDDGSSADQTAWRCERDGWLELAHCVDPGGCPASAPAAGSPCGAIGLDCFYSRAACSEDGVMQCQPGGWRALAPCETRRAASPCALTETRTSPISPGDRELFAYSLEQNVDAPHLALAGTQLLVSALLSGGSRQDHDVHAFLAQSADPRAMPARSLFTGGVSALGRHAHAPPFAAFARDRFVLAWGSNDGWPITTSATPGVYARALVLSRDGLDVTEPAALVDRSGVTATSVAHAGREGLLGLRRQSAFDASRYAGLSAPLTLAPTAVVRVDPVDDEGAKAPYSPQVSIALVRAARTSTGFVIASTQPAAGDEVDDSGVHLSFRAAAAAPSEIAAARIVEARIDAFSIAVLADDSVVVATRTATTRDRLALWKVTVGAAPRRIATIVDPSGGEATSFSVAASDDGFVLAAFVQGEGPTTGALLTLRKLDAEGSVVATIPSRVVTGASSSTRLALAVGEIDRTVHLAWPIQPLGAPSQLAYQRWLCGPG